MFSQPAPSSRQAPKELIAELKPLVQNLLIGTSGVNYTMLCSTDGFELVTANKLHDLNTGKLAAVSSSILAMVSAFVSEINLTGFQSVTLDADTGKAIFTSIPSANYPMILVVVASRNCLLGQLIHEIRQVSEDVVKLDKKYPK